MLTKSAIKTFQNHIWDYYQHHNRSMPFRHTQDPYQVFLSEVMLQQTQVSTVLKKFPDFVNRFPHFQALAAADLVEVLGQWLGLGYNRRAKFLHQAAGIIVRDYHGTLPLNPINLKKLPGIGKATASSIYVFATNKPHVFIETNIRRIYIYHFFQHQAEVTDQQLYPYVEWTLDYDKPRDWYYALMDYGTYLGKQLPNPNRKSKHYAKQSTFHGSSRQVRGQILHYLLTTPQATIQQLKKNISGNLSFFDQALSELYKEGFIGKKNQRFSIKKVAKKI